MLAAIALPAPRPGARSTYHKVLDREAWTHAVVSAAIVLQMNNQICRSARIVLGGVAPVPWRLPEVEKLIAGQRITPELAAKAGDLAVAGARPLAKNGYKVPLTRGMVGADDPRDCGSRISECGLSADCGLRIADYCGLQ